MTRDVPADLWKRMTSTVGLVSVRHAQGVNVMAAEWSYFINKEPMYATVVLAPGSMTRDLIAAEGEFALTLCADDQAELADFAGSFSLAAIDKSSSELITFGEPESIRSPWVDGGVVAVECRLRQVVELPVHTMYVGEVTAAHLPARPRPPLVKHDGMFRLGEPIERTAIVAAAQITDSAQNDSAQTDPTPTDSARMLRIAATGPAGGDWQISLIAPDGAEVVLGRHPATPYGDLSLECRLPPMLLGGAAGWRVKVERDGAKAGYAALTTGFTRLHSPSPS